MQINHVFPNRHAQKLVEHIIEAIKKQQDAGTAGHFEVVLTMGVQFPEATDSETLSRLHQINRAFSQFSADLPVRLNLVVEPVNPVNKAIGQYVEKSMQAAMELEANTEAAKPKLMVAADMQRKE